jgi:hypothetical protein
MAAHGLSGFDIFPRYISCVATNGDDNRTDISVFTDVSIPLIFEKYQMDWQTACEVTCLKRSDK